jgi:hypothetical protein
VGAAGKPAISVVVSTRDRLTALEAADAVAGTTLSPPGALTDASEVISRAPALAAEPFAPSNNLACRKAFFAAVPFDESYRRAAAEDRDWCLRLIATGHTLR